MYTSENSEGACKSISVLMLMRDAETIANLLSYDIGGGVLRESTLRSDRFFMFRTTVSYPDEAAAHSGFDLRKQFYGGVVPFPFTKTKASVTACRVGKPLIRSAGQREFTERVSKVVLAGYTAFHSSRRSPCSQPTCSPQGRGFGLKSLSGIRQRATVVATLAEFDQMQERWSASLIWRHLGSFLKKT